MIIVMVFVPFLAYSPFFSSCFRILLVSNWFGSFVRMRVDSVGWLVG